MPELSSNIVKEMLASCKAGAVEAASAFSSAFDAQLQLIVGESGTFAADALPEELNGPGLAVVLTIGDKGVVLVLPESTGLLPDWYTAPDLTAQNKLTTLAKELGANLLPTAYTPEDIKIAGVRKLSDVFKSGHLVEGAVSVPLSLIKDDGKQGTALLVWPVAKPEMTLCAVSSEQDSTSTSADQVPDQTDAESKSQPIDDSAYCRSGKRKLPSYTRSLLKVKIPVVVTLAEKKQTLGRVIELGPGQIIQFDKSCEEMLDLVVSNCKIAAGEAVKVGDKFGLRVTSIVLPDERFLPVKPEGGRMKDNV